MYRKHISTVLKSLLGDAQYTIGKDNNVDI